MRKNRINRSLRKKESSFLYKNRIAIISVISLLVVFGVLYLFLFTGLFKKDLNISKVNVSLDSPVYTSDGEYIYFLEDSTLKKIGKNGKIVWTSTFSSADMDLAVGTQVLCLYNKDTATVLDDNKTPLYTIPQSDFKINKVICGKNTVAVYSSLDNSTNSYIRIFNSTGSEIDRIELSNTYFLNYGFFGDSDNFWYMTLDTSGVEPITKITSILPSQHKTTGVYEIYNHLVSDVEFLNSNVYVNTTSSLQVYDTLGEVFFEKMIYGNKIMDVYQSKENIIFAYMPIQDQISSSSTIRVLSINGIDNTILLPTGIINTILSDKNIYCFTNDAIYLYNYKGEYISTTSLDFDVKSVERLSSNLVLIRSEKDSYLFSVGK